MLLPNLELLVQRSLEDTHAENRRTERKDVCAQNAEHLVSANEATELRWTQVVSDMSIQPLTA